MYDYGDPPAWMCEPMPPVEHHVKLTFPLVLDRDVVNFDKEYNTILERIRGAEDWELLAIENERDFACFMVRVYVGSGYGADYYDDDDYQSDNIDNAYSDAGVEVRKVLKHTAVELQDCSEFDIEIEFD